MEGLFRNTCSQGNIKIVGIYDYFLSVHEYYKKGTLPGAIKEIHIFAVVLTLTNIGIGIVGDRGKRAKEEFCFACSMCRR